jgi:hypothetical protein
MTDQLMFDTWAGLLGPLFPVDAQFTFKSRRRLICVGWAEPDELGRPERSGRTVAIAFTHLAWRTYRGARSARRARADVNLVALVRAALMQTGVENEHETIYDFPAGELRIEVGSIDLFPPPSAAAHLPGLSLTAG